MSVRAARFRPIRHMSSMTGRRTLLEGRRAAKWGCLPARSVDPGTSQLLGFAARLPVADFGGDFGGHAPFLRRVMAGAESTLTPRTAETGSSLVATRARLAPRGLAVVAFTHHILRTTSGSCMESVSGSCTNSGGLAVPQRPSNSPLGRTPCVGDVALRVASGTGPQTEAKITGRCPAQVGRPLPGHAGPDILCLGPRCSHTSAHSSAFPARTHRFRLSGFSFSNVTCFRRAFES